MFHDSYSQDLLDLTDQNNGPGRESSFKNFTIRVEALQLVLLMGRKKRLVIHGVTEVTECSFIGDPELSKGMLHFHGSDGLLGLIPLKFICQDGNNTGIYLWYGR